uniref:Uncharacterized protein n=1 Tax=Solanum tuberosum TaxID=4113 RepID=M1CBL4_SOLTU
MSPKHSPIKRLSVERKNLKHFPVVVEVAKFTRKMSFSDDSLNPKNGTKVDTHAASSSNTGSTVLIVCLALVAVVLLSFFLFKFWQKKKREEQYARLLKLFEEDDELELELGLRD